VAGAHDIKVADGVVTLDAVTWTLNGEQLVRRDSKREESWRAPGSKMTFATDGSALIVKIGDENVSAGFGEIWMASQRNVLGKLTQP
jgi:hypothetical protein